MPVSEKQYGVNYRAYMEKNNGFIELGGSHQIPNTSIIIEWPLISINGSQES